MGKKNLIIIIVNISLLYLFYYSYNKFNTYENIITKNQTISDYRITNIYCHNRISSNLDLIYNEKEYNVSISGLGFYKCDKLNNGSLKIDFYYNEKEDEIFTKYSVNKKQVYFFLIAFIFTLGFWLLPKKYW